MASRIPVQNAEHPPDPSLDRPDDRDEMWEGVLVMSPMADFEHQIIVNRLASILSDLIDWPGLGLVVSGCNVSDRDEGWTENFRIPDVAVFLHNGVGSIHGSHSLGGPDFLVEVLSEDDRALEKLPFYAANGVREALFIRRDPWAVELYRNVEGTLTLVNSATAESDALVSCSVVPMAVRLIRDADGGRPLIEVSGVGGEYRQRI